jgi:hypothetical protein
MADSVDFEQGYEAAVRLARKTEEQRTTLNEAETRLRLIDTLLFNLPRLVRGWHERGVLGATRVGRA